MDDYLSPDDPEATRGLQKPRDHWGEHGPWWEPAGECPVCHGYGRWILRRNEQDERRHFMTVCSQCDGWGVVRQEDLDCVHEMQERSQQWCRENRVPHFGNCYHVYSCNKCGKVKAHDSSG